MPTIGEKITQVAIEQLKKCPDGVRYADLVRLVQAVDSSFRTNTIHGNVWDLATRLPDKVYKPSRGLFRLVEFRDKDTDQLKAELVPKPPRKTKEEDFYAPFADWLVKIRSSIFGHVLGSRSRICSMSTSTCGSSKMRCGRSRCPMLKYLLVADC